MSQPSALIREVGRDTLRERVQAQLRNAIMKGAFEPGEALTVRGLAEAFGTSPTPVREALQQLTAENALVAEPNKAYRVPTITRERFLGVREVRVALEGLAARKAAATITAEDIRRLETVNRQLLKAIGKGDRKGYLEANERFHFGIYAAARSPVLLQTIRSLWLQIGPHLNHLFADIRVVADLNRFHEAALAALAAGDARAAERAVTEDILTAGEFMAGQARDDGMLG